MDAGWLINRLTPARQNEARWVELAEALEKFWEENFYKTHRQELTDILSYYTSSKDDLLQLMTDMAAFFEGQMSQEDIALGLTWSHNELQLKEYADILASTLRRKLGGAETEWVPMFAEKSKTYGTSFKTQAEVEGAGGSLGDWFMTSRGKIKVTSSTMRPYEIDALVDVINESVNRIKPLHIFFMGIISAMFHVDSLCRNFEGVWSRNYKKRTTGMAHVTPCIYEGITTTRIYRVRRTASL